MSLLSKINKVLASDTFAWVSIFGLFFFGGYLYYKAHYLDPQEAFNEIEVHKLAEDVNQLAEYLKGRGKKSALAEQALRELGGKGNDSAISALIAANSTKTVVGMLKAGEIKAEMLNEAITLILNDVRKNYRAIVDLGEIKNSLAYEALISELKSSDSEIRKNGLRDILRICGYSLRMLQQVPGKRNTYTPHSPKNTWLRNHLLQKLGTPELISLWKPIIPALIADDDIYVSGGALYLLIHFQMNETVNSRWSDIRSVIQRQIAGRRSNQAKNNWPFTKRALIEDVKSGNYDNILAALVAFIGIGEKEIIPELNSILNQEGDKKMAEAFLNSGSKELRVAAESWASLRGYKITQGPGYHPVNWGGW